MRFFETGDPDRAGRGRGRVGASNARRTEFVQNSIRWLGPDVSVWTGPGQEQGHCPCPDCQAGALRFNRADWFGQTLGGEQGADTAKISG